MEEKKYTLSDMKAAFEAGEKYESDCVALELRLESAVQEPDFKNWMKETYGTETGETSIKKF